MRINPPVLQVLSLQLPNADDFSARIEYTKKTATIAKQALSIDKSRPAHASILSLPFPVLLPICQRTRP